MRMIIYEEIMLIVGHRGVSGYYPENTQASIEAAARLGLKWIEVDIQLTKDNHLVIAHDASIDRCSNGHGTISELTLKQLKQYNFGSWFDHCRFSSEKILTIEELFQIAQHLSLSINLELKVFQKASEQLCNRLEKSLSLSSFPINNLIFSSFDHQALLNLRQKLPNAKLGALCERLDDKTKALIGNISAYSCHLHHLSVTNNDIDYLHDKGVQAWAYTVNKPEQIERLGSIDAIFTDFPDRFVI